MSVSARGRGIPILVAGILVAAGATASVLPSAAALTVAPPGTRVLASGPSGFPDRIDVVGADAQWVVFANEDQSGLGPYVDGYDTVPVGGGRPVPIGGTNGVLGGETLAGSTFVYLDEFGQPYWIDLTTHHSGKARFDASDLATWQTAVPGGGAWVETADTTPGTTVDTLVTTTTAAPNATPTVLATLPNLGSGAYAAVADTHGIAVVAGSTVDYYSFATRTVRTLDTGGASSAGFTCTSASTTMIGCFDTTEVVPVPIDGSAPLVFDVMGVDQVAVTPTATAFIVRSSGLLGGGSGFFGARRFFESGFAASGVVAVGDDFFYSRIGTRVGGVYALPSDFGTPRRLARAPGLPRVTFRIALTAGRVSWIDDSTTNYPVRSRRLEGAAHSVGPTMVTASASSGVPPGGGIGIDGATSGLSISGTRSLFTVGEPTTGASVGRVVLVGSHGRQVLAAAGNGDVGLSGERALWGTPSGHLMMRELAAGRTVDLTSDVGPDLVTGTRDLGSALFGPYLAYAHGGFAWRLDLASGRRVRAGRTNSNAGVGNVMTAGDWVISRYGGGASAQLKYRNVRRLGPVRSVGGDRTLESVSPAGFVSMTPSGEQLFRAWGSTTDIALPAAEGPVHAVGGELAWIGLDGYPRSAPFPAAAARPGGGLP
jgi:hypothetical protein